MTRSREDQLANASANRDKLEAEKEACEQEEKAMKEVALNTGWNE